VFGYNFIESEPICMKSGHSEYNVVAGALADFGCNRRSSDNLTGSRNFVFFLVRQITHDFDDFPSAKFHEI